MKTVAEDDHRHTAPPPSRYEATPKPSQPHILTATDKVKQRVLCLDLLIKEIERRFDQPGLRRLASGKKLLSDACCSTNIDKGRVQEVVDVYDDNDRAKLARELRMLPDLVHLKRTLGVTELAAQHRFNK